jgi:lipid II:glycine glycyltransferase (peptidoglycan interpeptide bridge formation enzyme)
MKFQNIERIEDRSTYMDQFQKYDLDLLQSWQWGQIKDNEWEPIRLFIDEVPVNLLIRKLPLLNKYFGYIPRGFNPQTISSEWLNDLTLYCSKELNLSHLIIDPNLAQNSEYESLFGELGFKTSGKTIQPNQTNVIDLTRSDHDLWMDLRASTRRNIKKSSERFGCKVEKHKSGEEAIKRFNAVNAQINTRNKFIKHSSDYFSNVWKILSNSSMAKIFIVTHDNKDIAAYFLAYTTKQAFELYGGVTDEGKPLRAGHTLKWECIKDAKASGLIKYDQWGVARFLKDPKQPENKQKWYFDPHDELSYISEFKSSFGGTYTEFMPQQTMVFHKPSFLFFYILQKANKIVTKIRKI